MRSTTAAGATTEYLYDGDSLVAEYNSSGTLLRRYVHGPSINEPLVWYEGAGLTDRRYHVSDHLGSIIAEDGATTALNQYGPYGEPQAWTGGRFRYTGQIALPEVALFHYRARVYDPVLGRFLQTDPVGYEDDLNLYTYTRNDPINMVDVTGRRAVVRNGQIHIRPERINGPSVTVPNNVGARGVQPGLPVGRNSSFHAYQVRTQTGLSGADNLRALGAGLRANPTPGNDTLASASGSRNDVGPLPMMGESNFVRSFSIASPDPSRFSDITVNYTISGEHGLAEGFVMRYGEMGADGSIDLVSYGEGNAWQQNEALGFIWYPQVDQIWTENQQQVVDDCVRSGSCNR